MNKQQRGAAMVYIAAILADMVSRRLNVDDIELLAAFAVTFADNLALIAENMQKGDENNEEVFFPPSLII
ncbi:MAG: hypothetical protein PHF89_03655 [Eubacteriales bacterium]|nr:hypothetical protein [Eubacteriales bacterium]